MNDPHVEKLHYRLIHDDSTDYKNAESLQVEENDFRVRLDQNGATFEMKVHCATEQEARALVGPYVDNWNGSAALDLSPGQFALKYRFSEIVDRKPTPGIVEAVGIIESASASMTAAAHISKGSFPEPPKKFSLSPDVNSMIQRYSEFRLGREKLTSMAYFCLTVLETSAAKPGKGGWRKMAAQKYAIHEGVLRKLGELTAMRGSETEARKAQATGYAPITGAESSWILDVVHAVILRVGQYVHDPSARLRPITMADFPKI